MSHSSPSAAPAESPGAAPAVPPDVVPLAADARLVAPALADGRALVLAPVHPATLRAAGQLVVAAFWTLAVAVVLLTGAGLGVSLVVLVVGLPVLVVTLVLARGYGRAERARLAAQLGAAIPAPAPPVRRRGFRGWWLRTVEGHAWTALAHAVVVLLLAWTAVAVVTALTAVALVALAALVVPALRVTPVVGPWWLALVVLPLAAWGAALVAQATTLLQLRLSRAMLGGRSRAEAERAARAAEQRAEVAEVRAVRLHETRAAAVEAADAERRRIERDLHDGAQQRLVALGVELGVARRAAAHDPEAAVRALDSAHAEVKEVLAELRDLVRGVHPAVLTDRGLDAALSALAARSPVRVEVDASGLDGASVGTTPAQAAAYFVVAEALTNVAKHAGATSAAVRADVVGTGADARLRVRISDDGVGGARATPGSGLDGLRRRVEALDGSFDLVSPVGAGTVLTVEVPCAS
ncbi:sensor histidine kinase [Cellulomonas sp. JZ18]|uniref:sensor histidine kinase n=1 Tax=Cellulomonas sp. JZ18 TaxID=2654191 RepID=UPI0012D48533|nr:histidine kinase [Cellulomonas sp. JZ18]QGQ18261.1 sensor histidine kinase [Cellulomonas sp. JZ18]